MLWSWHSAAANLTWIIKFAITSWQKLLMRHCKRKVYTLKATHQTCCHRIGNMDSNKHHPQQATHKVEIAFYVEVNGVFFGGGVALLWWNSWSMGYARASCVSRCWDACPSSPVCRHQCPCSTYAAWCRARRPPSVGCDGQWFHQDLQTPVERQRKQTKVYF